MPREQFTDLKLRALKPPDKGQTDYWDASTPSFGLRVSHGGSKTFILKHRNRRITIGRFPLLSLAQARQQARLYLAEATLGRLRPKSMGYLEAVELYLEDKARRRRPSTLGEYRRSLTKLPFQTLSEIDHAAINRVLKPCTKAYEYNHRLVALKIFLNFCKKRRWIEHNPADGYSQHSTQSRSRVLTDHEIMLIWQATAASSSFNSIVRLLLLTGQRRGEIAAIQTSWIAKQPQSSSSQSGSLPEPSYSTPSPDLWTLTIPPSVTKNGIEHTIPLGPLSVTLLAPLLKQTSHQSSTSHIFLARGGRPFTKFAKASEKLWQITGIKGAVVHDIRRTYRSNLARLGVRPEIAERLVNHVSSRSAMEVVYDRYSYLSEMKKAVETYEAWFRNLVY